MVDIGRGVNGGRRTMNNEAGADSVEKGESGSEARRRGAAYRGSDSVN